MAKLAGPINYRMVRQSNNKVLFIEELLEWHMSLTPSELALV